MYRILQNLIKYIETEDEKYLNDKYLKSVKFSIQSMLDKLNLPSFEVESIGEYKRGYNKGYIDGVVAALKLWAEEASYQEKGSQKDMESKKEIDEQEAEDDKNRFI